MPTEEYSYSKRTGSPSPQPGYDSPYAPPPGYQSPYPPPPRYQGPIPHPPGMVGDSPTVKGLFYMLIAGVIIIIGDFLGAFNICGLISFIGYIIALVGFWKIYSDRGSYPEPHTTNMKHSLIFYVLGIILVIIGIVMIVVGALTFTFQAIEQGADSSDFESFLFNTIIAGVIVSIGSLLWVFGRYKLLVGLMPENKIGFLKAAVILVIIVMIIGIIGLGIVYSGLKGEFKDFKIEPSEGDISEDSLDNLTAALADFEKKTWGIDIINLALSIISQILFLLCFYFAYDYQKNNPQLRKGSTPYPSTHPPPY